MKCSNLHHPKDWSTSFECGKCSYCNIDLPLAPKIADPKCPRKGPLGRRREGAKSGGSAVDANPKCPRKGPLGLRGERARSNERVVEREIRRERRKRLRNEKWEDRARIMGKANVTVVWTWNIQRSRVIFPKRNRFNEILRTIAKTDTEIVLFSELAEEKEGVLWVKARDLYGVLIYGKKSGVFLRDSWALDWREQGSVKTCGTRSTAVEVNGVTAIAVYQPVWGGDKTEFESYREELNEMLLRCRKKSTLIVGGDFNASVGEGIFREPTPGLGPYGLGNCNAAGKDLINWCNGQDLAFVNSFFRHGKRGTWKTPGQSSWHEIDGFAVKQDQRSRLVKNVRTVNLIGAPSDHLPKRADFWLNHKRSEKSMKKPPRVNWEALKKPEVWKAYTEAVDKKFDNPDVSWTKMMEQVNEAGKETCGLKEKSNLSPWLDNHEKEIDEFQSKLSQLTKECDSTEDPMAKENLRSQRKLLRSRYKRLKKQWEEEWWMDVVKDAQKAEETGDSRMLYQTLRRIGCKDLRTVQEEHFSPNEYRNHFMKVSKDRYERTMSEISELMDELTVRDDPEAITAAERLDEDITFQEFVEEINKMKDGAPGIDAVRVCAIKKMSCKAKKKLYDSVRAYLHEPHQRWPEETKEGWVIPLHKKGARDKLDNYRGVCLLPLISRIIARIYATRIRRWAEVLGILGENQNGFRQGRSTCDSTQIILRVDEETKRVMGKSNEAKGRPGAVLLDITKAYPRANRPVLWKMLSKLGMGPKTLKVLEGLHEGTIFRVKGRTEMSDDWRPARGLREGCATSPILFNIYHAEAMRRASRKRHQLATAKGRECGLRWAWVPGNSFPSLDPRNTMKSSQREEFIVEDSLFADDSSLIGWLDELAEGKEVVKKAMLDFEEVCHDGKEEVFSFGSDGAKEVRMLGTRIGKAEDLKARIQRGYTAAAKIRKWLWKSTLKRRTKALIIQAVVESTMLFDSNARAWSPSDIQKLQSVVDKSYRSVWNNGKKMTLVRMQQEGKNMFAVRRELEISSLRTKIETRALQRIGHVLRMPDHRLTKKVVLGRWTEERQQKGLLRGGIIAYWKRLFRESGLDWTKASGLVSDRKKWKEIVRKRNKEMTTWEEEMSEWRRTEAKPLRVKTSPKNDHSCGVENCSFVAKSTPRRKKCSNAVTAQELSNRKER